MFDTEGLYTGKLGYTYKKLTQITRVLKGRDSIKALTQPDFLVLDLPKLVITEKHTGVIIYCKKNTLYLNVSSSLRNLTAFSVIRSKNTKIIFNYKDQEIFALEHIPYDASAPYVSFFISRTTILNVVPGLIINYERAIIPYIVLPEFVTKSRTYYPFRVTMLGS